MATTLPPPSFIERNPDTIVAEMIADYQNRVGRVLEPAQAERLLINALAYRELLLRNQVQQAAQQNLVAFATFPMLDYLGELLGVTRLPATAAECTITYTLVAGHTGVTIPSGHRVGSVDGRVIFTTKAAVPVVAGTTTASVAAICQTVGVAGNSYLAGDVSEILDPLPFISAAANTATTAGGSDEETDEQLRERIRLAPSAFSTAGSRGAYQFHARAAHPTIIDVAVTSPTPGTVNIYPLVQGGGTTPTEVLNAVLAACSADKVRPLTDTVAAVAPTEVTYSITVQLVLYTGADQSAITAQVQQALEAYRDGRGGLLGLDIIRAQIIQACVVEGVYNVTVVSPAADIIIPETSFGRCTSIGVSVTGFNNG